MLDDVHGVKRVSCDSGDCEDGSTVVVDVTVICIVRVSLSSGVTVFPGTDIARSDKEIGRDTVAKEVDCSLLIGIRIDAKLWFTGYVGNVSLLIQLNS